MAKFWKKSNQVSKSANNIPGNAKTVTVVDAGGDTTTWVLLGNSQTGNESPATDAGLTYNATTNALTADTFIGALTGNANTVTTNANLTGPITSTGNATSVASQTGTGSKFVMDNTPTLITPILGVASATSLTLGSGSTLSSYIDTTYVPAVTLVGGAGNTVPQYITNTGFYTRIGNIIFVDVYLVGDGGNEGAGTGLLTISLPVTSSASYPLGFFNAGFVLNNATYTPAVGQINAGTSVVTLYQSGTMTPLNGANQNNITRSIRLQFSYRA